MKNIVKIVCLLLFVSLSFSFQKPETKNVTVIVHLDDELAQVEQKVYIHSFCDWISGREQCIWDSVQTFIGQKTIELQAYVPIENKLEVMFAKEGPEKLRIYAKPGDVVEIEVNYNDESHISICKEAIKGNFHNQCIALYTEEKTMWNERNRLKEEGKADSLEWCNQRILAFYRGHLAKRDIPSMTLHSYVVMLQLFFADYMYDGELQAIKEQLSKAYPDDPRCALDYGYVKTQTERGRQMTARLKELTRERREYKKKQQEHALGSNLYLNLRGLDGQKVALTDLKSRYIYVDVWASWCAPCRRQFPYIKECLERYPEDLSVYAISIDANHTLWRKAIVEDSLQHFVHVIGTDDKRVILKQVQDLGVKRIPRNFLLDHKCRIVAKDLHDEELMQTLDSLMAK